MLKYVLVTLCALSSITASAGTVRVMDLGFKAPSIEGRLSNPNPAVGSILLDTGDSTFYGFTDNNEWVALGGTALTVPSGVISSFGGTTAPTGYLMCNGQAVSRTTYADLFAVIGTAYGNGDGSTTFNVPDLRGRFVRGTSSATGRDPDASSRTSENGGNSGDQVGSVQADQYKSHTHNMTTRTSSGVTGPYVVSSTSTASEYTDGISIQAAGGNETRPKNVNVNFIIKY